MSFVIRTLRALATLALALIALLVLVEVWDVYMVAPWTRDGRVFAQTVIVAPEVSGTVVSVPLVENQLVHKGDILFQLDASRFEIAIAQAQAQMDQATVQLKEREEDEARRAGLQGLVSNEERRNATLAVNIANAALGGAVAAVNLAKLNLARSTVYAPTTGYITHLRLQAGDYAVAGTPVVTVLDSATFRVIAYFEETKLSKIAMNAPATIKLMGYPQRLSGYVRGIGRGIGDQNDMVDKLGLPEVNPVFDWVRLAQRIPVDIAIRAVPPGVVLASGMTCSVEVDDGSRHRRDDIGDRLRRWFEETL
jgi:multidrug resistance efflux pump